MTELNITYQDIKLQADITGLNLYDFELVGKFLDIMLTTTTKNIDFISSKLIVFVPQAKPSRKRKDGTGTWCHWKNAAWDTHIPG